MRIAHATQDLDSYESAFIHAVGLAAHSGASEVASLHVTQGAGASQTPAQPSALLERWGMLNANITHRVYECPGHDDIADELIAACETLHPELLIMATHARSGLARVLAGSIAEAVARNVSMPSLLLPLQSRGLIDARSGTLQLQRLLIAGGSQSDAQQGVDAAAWFLNALRVTGVRLSLLHAGTDTPAPTVVAPAGVTLELDLRSGSLEQAITSAEHAQHSDLIVMVTHGHDQLRDVLSSSHTERVLHQSKLPLLWIPASAQLK